MWEQIIWTSVCLLFYILLKIKDPKPNKVKYYAKVISMYFYLAMCALIVSPVILLKKRNIRNSVIGLNWAQRTASMYGMCWQLQNNEFLRQPGGAVIISNHQSSMDAVGVIFAWDKIDKAVAIVKKELWCLGLMAWVAYKCGTEFIDRRNPKKAYEELGKIRSVLNDGIKIWIFPEGTRNADNNTKLLPFKKGAFVIAVAAQVPIIPVVFSPLYFVNEKKHLFYNNGKAIMRCLEPVPTVGLTSEDIPELIERVHKIVLEAFEKLSKEILNDLPMDTPLATEILI